MYGYDRRIAAVPSLEERLHQAVVDFSKDCLRHLLKWVPITATNWGLYDEGKASILMQNGPGGVSQMGFDAKGGQDDQLHIRVSLRPSAKGLFVLVNVINQSANKSSNPDKMFESGQVKAIVQWVLKQIETGLGDVTEPLS